jgi:hypothetical protein
MVLFWSTKQKIVMQIANQFAYELVGLFLLVYQRLFEMVNHLIIDLPINLLNSDGKD